MNDHSWKTPEATVCLVTGRFNSSPYFPALIKGGTLVNGMITNIDVEPTIMEAMGLKKPVHMDGASVLTVAEGKSIRWRKDVLHDYAWKKKFPQTPTSFAVRGDRYKCISFFRDFVMAHELPLMTRIP
jgi:arylsulfatase A-like enzyme